MMLELMARSFEITRSVTVVFAEENQNMDRMILAVQEMMKCVSAYQKTVRKERLKKSVNIRYFFQQSFQWNQSSIRIKGGDGMS
jgi:hypothetical protein